MNDISLQQFHKSERMNGREGRLSPGSSARSARSKHSKIAADKMQEQNWDVNKPESDF